MGLLSTETKIDHNKPNLILLESKEKICYIVDVVCPFDPRIEKEAKDKVKNNTELKHEILKMWKNEVTKIYILLVVIVALGSVSKNKRRFLEMD